MSELDIADVAESRQSFAERLGDWLDLSDAISLSAALKPGAASGAGEGAKAAVLREEYARTRAFLTEAIGADDVATAGNARIKFPLPAAGIPVESADFAPYHRYYLAQQREMEASINPLRANARAALASASPAFRQLAALDAVLEEAMRARERSLLATVPLLLGKRFDRLRAGHSSQLAEAGLPDAMELWIRPGGWLAAFCKETQGVLLAELDFRLQPVMGLIEALGNEVTKHQ